MSHALKPLKKVPIYLKVYEAIEEDILSGELPEGAALPTEAELCEQFGVTRSSVREGIRLLEQADLVRRGGHKKLIVTRPKSHDVAASTSARLVHGGVTFQEVWQALAIMYPSAAGLAASALSASDVARVQEVHDQLQTSDELDFETIVDGAVDFFQTIASGLNNRVMLALLQSLNMLIEASLRQVIERTPEAKSRILKAQREILGALKTQDAERAQKWMSRHIDDLKRGYEVAGVNFQQSIS